MKTDRELCAELLSGNTAALAKLTARHARQIDRIAEERFRRNDMGDDLMAAVLQVLCAQEYSILTQWFAEPADSMGGLFEKLGVETPLLDGDA